MTASSSPSSAHEAQTIRQWMSALSDGQHDDVQAACKVWADDPQARQAWHAYQLIGDVLRSDDLASPPAHDEAFLTALRTRLAQEPPIVAPTPLAASAALPNRAVAAGGSLSRRWAVAAAAAGVMMVGGVVVMLRDAGPTEIAKAPAGPSGPAVAQLPPVPGLPSVQRTAGSVIDTAGGQSAAEPQWRVLDGQVVREAQLDAYLRAHRGTLAPRPGVIGGRYETVGLER